MQTPRAKKRDCAVFRPENGHLTRQKIPASRSGSRCIPGRKMPYRITPAHTPALHHNEGTPLQTSSQPCNSTALAPQGVPPSVHDLPSQERAPNGGVTQRLTPFRSFPCAHSAVRGGFPTQIPFMLQPGRKKRPLRHAATRRHRTQYLLNFTVTDSISEIQANVNNATTRVFHIRPWHYNSISILRRALFARI